MRRNRTKTRARDICLMDDDDHDEMNWYSTKEIRAAVSRSDMLMRERK